jgi:hypothetical protein
MARWRDLFNVNFDVLLYDLTSRGQSVGCHLNNAKREHLRTPLYPARDHPSWNRRAAPLVLFRARLRRCVPIRPTSIVSGYSSLLEVAGHFGGWSVPDTSMSSLFWNCSILALSGEQPTLCPQTDRPSRRRHRCVEGDRRGNSQAVGVPPALRHQCARPAARDKGGRRPIWAIKVVDAVPANPASACVPLPAIPDFDPTTQMICDRELFEGFRDGLHNALLKIERREQDVERLTKRNAYLEAELKRKERHHTCQYPEMRRLVGPDSCNRFSGIASALMSRHLL